MELDYKEVSKIKKRAVFLDRDGVINQNRDDYVKNIDEFVFLPTVFEAIRQLTSLDYYVIIITNQSVVNRGIISLKELETIHLYMLKKFEENSCKIEKIYCCVHRPDENCPCRKPRTALIEKALKEFDIESSNSWLIGDSISDIEAANKVGLNGIKLERNGNLLDAVKTMIKKSN